MQSDIQQWIEQIEALTRQQRKEERAKARAKLKFNPNFKMKNPAELKFMFPFAYFKNFKLKSLPELKNILFALVLIYSTKAFSDSFFSSKNKSKFILLKLSDFRRIFGYNHPIPKNLKRFKRGKRTYLIFVPEISILTNFNFSISTERGKKPTQYKAFSFQTVLRFMNTFKAPAIPFLFYILNLYSYSNSPRIQHNAKNLLKACKITLKQGKQKTINRINKYLLFLFENGIIADKEFAPLGVESLDESKSLNIRLKLF